MRMLGINNFDQEMNEITEKNKELMKIEKIKKLKILGKVLKRAQ
jgi:hypothetical protein